MTICASCERPGGRCRAGARAARAGRTFAKPRTWRGDDRRLEVRGRVGGRQPRWRSGAQADRRALAARPARAQCGTKRPGGTRYRSTVRRPPVSAVQIHQRAFRLVDVRVVDAAVRRSRAARATAGSSRSAPAWSPRPRQHQPVVAMHLADDRVRGPLRLRRRRAGRSRRPRRSVAAGPGSGPRAAGAPPSPPDAADPGCASPGPAPRGPASRLPQATLAGELRGQPAHLRRDAGMLGHRSPTG